VAAAAERWRPDRRATRTITDRNRLPSFVLPRRPGEVANFAGGNFSPIGGIDANAILIFLCDRSQPGAPPAW
jgi:hypothetical protein